MRWPITIIGLLIGHWCSAQNSLAVTIVLNEPDAGGVLQVALCPDKPSYDKEIGCTLQTVPATGRVVTVTFAGVKTGACAVKVFHDVNNNGKLDTSWIGWPQEPYGFSNDAPVNMGPPSFKLAAITLKEGANTARIALR
jgi:uncharacterized protein (DUF2141 family)